ncbi:MAG: ferritin [Muribaculaceae bacterium]|nr:ferritin [Muribaculaceae bacterium]
MISNKVQEAINNQINAEFWSAYLYLSMAQFFHANGRQGLANWFDIQFKEEQAHAQILINYLNSRGGRVLLKAIDSVPTEWKSELDAFEAVLAHEEKVTAMINNLYSIAESEHDYATRGRLDWFVSEQVEEEETARTIIDRLKLIGDNGLAMYTLDTELGARTYTEPSPLATNE